MKLSDFDYLLPAQLIAQLPLPERSGSRLLCLNGDDGAIEHRRFKDLSALLSSRDLIVFNNTKVIKARLLGNKTTGGRVEVLVERILPNSDRLVLAQIGANKSIKLGTKLLLENEISAEVVAKQGNFFVVRFLTSGDIWQLLERYGRIPLPPYIERAADDADLSRYQSIFAEHAGAVAAPTASLHFDQTIIARLKAQGTQIAFLTLHVGAGTFQPVKVEQVEQHKMHAEYMEISSETCEQIKNTKKQGGKVIAVGTTCVRCLETAAKSGEIQPFKGDTDIFIYPGYKFKCVDGLITNFHLPKSTLLMLVCAFAGYDNVMRAYQEAIERQYRFFSYGDAMVIIKSIINC